MKTGYKKRSSLGVRARGGKKFGILSFLLTLPPRPYKKNGKREKIGKIMKSHGLGSLDSGHQ